jgi:UDP-N-acetylmuramyl tripeptide synthase
MVELANNKLVLYLVKNPAGFDMVLQTLRQIQTDQKFSLAVLINDKIADGRDVSWLWDIHLEDFVRSLPAGRLSRVVTGGTRGLDMLLRFQIAGQPVVLADNFDSLDDLVDFLEREKGFWVVLCTYTALLELRAKLSRKVNLPQISEAGN